MTTYRVHCVANDSVRTTSRELATKAIPAVARATSHISGVVESAGFLARNASGTGDYGISFTLETDDNVFRLVSVLAAWCDSVRVFRMDTYVLPSGIPAAEGVVVADYPPVYAPGRTNFPDAWVTPSCWCGVTATVVNDATDASDSHAACDMHAKAGYVLIGGVA